jgi:hypothetical protein
MTDALTVTAVNLHIHALFVGRSGLYIPYADGWRIGFTGFKGAREDTRLGAQWLAARKEPKTYYEAQIAHVDAAPIVLPRTPESVFQLPARMWTCEDLVTGYNRPVELIYFDLARSVRAAREALFDQIGLPRDAQPL